MKKIVACLLLLSSSLPVLADEGGYLGVSMGSGKPGVTPAALTMSTTSSFIYGGVAGYQYNKNLAVQVQYGGLGKATDVAGNTSKIDALSMTAVGLLPLNNHFDLTAKIGIANAKTVTSGATATNLGTTRAGLTYGIGAQYNINKSMALRLELDRYAVATSNAAGVKTKGNATVINLDALYKF